MSRARENWGLATELNSTCSGRTAAIWQCLVQMRTCSILTAPCPAMCCVRASPSASGRTHVSGRELDGGVVAKPGSDPGEAQLGIVALVVRGELLGCGARTIESDPPVPDAGTKRPDRGSFPGTVHKG